MVDAIASDYEDNKLAAHRTCKVHHVSAILDKKGDVTDEVEYTHLTPCIYWERTDDKGRTWKASERLDDEELDVLTALEPSLQMKVIKPHEYRNKVGYFWPKAEAKQMEEGVEAER